MSKALFSIAACNTICFSPFGIDGMMTPLNENDLLAQMGMLPFADHLPSASTSPGLLLAEAYELLHLLWSDIRQAQRENRIYAFFQQPQEIGMEFILDDYVITVNYGGGGRAGMSPAPPKREGAPCAGGFFLRTEKDRFLVCGVSFKADIRAKYASREQAFLLEKKELCLVDGKLTTRRILNGDERNFLSFGSHPAVQELAFYRR